MDIDGVYVDNITIKLIQFGSSFPKEKLVPKISHIIHLQPPNIIKP